MMTVIVISNNKCQVLNLYHLTSVSLSSYPINENIHLTYFYVIRFNYYKEKTSFFFRTTPYEYFFIFYAALNQLINGRSIQLTQLLIKCVQGFQKFQIKPRIHNKINIPIIVQSMFELLTT